MGRHTHGGRLAGLVPTAVGQNARVGESDCRGECGAGFLILCASTVAVRIAVEGGYNDGNSGTRALGRRAMGAGSFVTVKCFILNSQGLRK